MITCPQSHHTEVAQEAIFTEQNLSSKISDDRLKLRETICNIVFIRKIQSYYTEQNMTFGLVLGWLAILKEIFWGDYEQLLRAVFSCFHGQKFIFLFFLHSSVHTKKLKKTLKKKHRTYFFGLNT